MVLSTSVGASFFDTGGLEYKYNKGIHMFQGGPFFFFFYMAVGWLQCCVTQLRY